MVAWIYNKTENVSDYSPFTHLLREADASPEVDSPNFLTELFPNFLVIRPESVAPQETDGYKELAGVVAFRSWRRKEVESLQKYVPVPVLSVRLWIMEKADWFNSILG